MHIYHTDQPTRALSTHISTVRARNRAEQIRAQAIENQVERLEVFAVVVGVDVLKGLPLYREVILQHATAMVDAAIALTKDETH